MRLNGIAAALAAAFLITASTDAASITLIDAMNNDGSFRSNVAAGGGVLGDDQSSDFWAIGLTTASFESLSRDLGPPADGNSQDDDGGSYVQNAGGTRSLTSNNISVAALQAGDSFDFTGFVGTNAATTLGWNARINFENGPPLLLGIDTVASTETDWVSIGTASSVPIDAGNVGSTFVNFEFRLENSGSGVTQSYADNFTVTLNEVPEPGAGLLALMGLTFAGAVGMRRRLG